MAALDEIAAGRAQNVEVRNADAGNLLVQAHRAGDAAQPRLVLPGESIPVHGLHADFRHRGLPAGGGELDRDRDEYKLSPEAFAGYRDLPYNVTQATWSSPITG